jgi:hypothetical protein
MIDNTLETQFKQVLSPLNIALGFLQKTKKEKWRKKHKYTR